MPGLAANIGKIDVLAPMRFPVVDHVSALPAPRPPKLQASLPPASSGVVAALNRFNSRHLLGPLRSGSGLREGDPRSCFSSSSGPLLLGRAGFAVGRIGSSVDLPDQVVDSTVRVRVQIVGAFVCVVDSPVRGIDASGRFLADFVDKIACSDETFVHVFAQIAGRVVVVADIRSQIISRVADFGPQLDPGFVELGTRIAELGTRFANLLKDGREKPDACQHPAPANNHDDDDDIERPAVGFDSRRMEVYLTSKSRQDR